MSSYYKMRIQELEESRLKLIGDVAELRAQNDRLERRLKRMKSKMLRDQNASKKLPSAHATLAGPQ